MLCYALVSYTIPYYAIFCMICMSQNLNWSLEQSSLPFEPWDFPPLALHHLASPRISFIESGKRRLSTAKVAPKGWSKNSALATEGLLSGFPRTCYARFCSTPLSCIFMPCLRQIVAIVGPRIASFDGC